MGEGAFRCSLYLSPNVLDVSPMYSSSHSNLSHLNLKITPLFFVMWSLSFEATKPITSAYIPTMWLFHLPQGNNISPSHLVAIPSATNGKNISHYMFGNNISHHIFGNNISQQMPLLNPPQTFSYSGNNISHNGNNISHVKQ